MSVERDALSDDARVAAISCPPERVRQQGADRAASVAIVGIGEQPSSGWSHAERREVTAADIKPACPDDVAVSRQVPPVDAPRDERGERLLLGPNIAPERGGEDAARQAKSDASFAVLIDPERHELLRRGDRQRLEAQRVHQLEDGRVGARAQGEREDRDERECGILTQQARAEAKVLPRRFEERQRSHVVQILANARRVSEAAMSGVFGVRR